MTLYTMGLAAMEEAYVPPIDDVENNGSHWGSDDTTEQNYARAQVVVEEARRMEAQDKEELPNMETAYNTSPWDTDGEVGNGSGGGSGEGDDDYSRVSSAPWDTDGEVGNGSGGGSGKGDD